MDDINKHGAKITYITGQP